MSTEKNIFWQPSRLTTSDRFALNQHQAAILWLTGLSGSGKTTLAFALEQILFKKGFQVFVLDGDNIRHGLNLDLGFGQEDRKENIRRIGEVAKLFASAGMIVIVSFISPYRQDRAWARQLNQSVSFFEIFLDCPIEICENRDVKGLYQKARQGLLSNFTGIDGKYEAPLKPELVLNTHLESRESCLQQIIDLLIKQNVISS